ncbi:MAG: ComF family protein [Blastocatellia bacterium]
MDIRTLIGEFRDGFLSVGYPSSCRLCGGSIESWEDGVVCRNCWTDPELTWTFGKTAVCSRCGNPLVSSGKAAAANASSTSSKGWTGTDGEGNEHTGRERFCGLCSTLSLTVSRSAGAYKGAVEASVLFLKTAPHLCTRLRRIIVESLNTNSDALRADFVAPIPLHRSRLRERGFNQALVIARAVSKCLSVPVRNGLLGRSKQTGRHRAGMDPIDRARSVERAFEVYNPSAIEGRSILLVDDVYTTGATVGEAAKALVSAGAAAVKCFTIARVVLPHSAAVARHKSATDRLAP